MRIAITVIAYNRVNSIKRLVSSLQVAVYDGKEVDLIVSVDKSNSDEVAQYVQTIEWPHGMLIKEIKPENMGLRKHILSCGGYFDKYGYDALIVLEDDLFVSPYFYMYACDTVRQYKDNKDIAGISLYSLRRNRINGLPFEPVNSGYDVYFMQLAQSWGQIWLRDQWKQFTEWYDQNQDYDFRKEIIPSNVRKWPKTSWLKYHIAYCIENNKFFVYPYTSFSTNFADAGTHYKVDTDDAQTPLANGYFSLRMPRLSDEMACKYDANQENMLLHQNLGIEAGDLCVDLFGSKELQKSEKYLLTRKKYPFEIKKTFGLKLKPHELNITCSVAGEDIFLYDRTKRKNNISRISKSKQWLYYHNHPVIMNIPYISMVFQRYRSQSIRLMKRLKKR